MAESERERPLPGEQGLGIKVWGTAILICVVAVLLIWPLIPPALPKKIRVGTGPDGGVYARFGLRLKDRLAQQGIEVELVPSGGAAENVVNLLREDEPLDLAIVQSGVISPDEATRLRSVASIFYEPCWAFYRSDLDPPLGREAMKGWRIAIGPPGSGTNDLAQRLLEGDDVVKVEIGGMDAVRALQAGELEAALLVTAIDSPWLQPLFEDPGITLHSFPLAKAMVRHYRFLQMVEIPQGLVDLRRNLPPVDKTVIATTASLVVRMNTNPGLIPLLIETCEVELEQGSLLAAPGEFPSEHHVDAPLAEEADRYFRRGPSFFHRYLPFRIAHLLTRLMLLILPLLTLLYPLFKSAGPLYRWLVLRRVYRWYRVLRALETELDQTSDPGDLDQVERDLERVDEEIRHTSVPSRFAADLYQLRQHRRLLVERCRAMRRSAG